eukprot:GHVU01206919.1.p1 GENE.GHVU01206919.1~~GHVU01206919.1.p1  ORF type:complete len:114 (-),score=10.46 GHVU01206919.1:102-443(-)
MLELLCCVCAAAAAAACCSESSPDGAAVGVGPSPWTVSRRSSVGHLAPRWRWCIFIIYYYLSYIVHMINHDASMIISSLSDARFCLDAWPLRLALPLPVHPATTVQALARRAT